MIKSAESLATVHTHTIISNEQTLEAFLYPKITIELAK